MILSKISFFILVLLLGIGLLYFFGNIEKIIKNLEKRINRPLVSFEKKVSNIIGLLVLLYIPLVFIFYVWYVPNVYIIDKCNSYNSSLLIVPKKVNNITMTLDADNCYIINNSKSVIRISSIVYDMTESESNLKLLKELRNQEYNHNSKLLTSDYEIIINKVILPKKTLKVKYKKVHYIFEKPDKSISTKYEGKIRYKLICNN